MRAILVMDMVEKVTLTGQKAGFELKSSITALTGRASQKLLVSRALRNQRGWSGWAGGGPVPQ